MLKSDRLLPVAAVILKTCGGTPEFLDKALHTNGVGSLVSRPGRSPRLGCISTEDNQAEFPPFVT